MELPWTDPTRPLALIGRDDPLALHLAHPGDGQRRAALETFIRSRFAERYQARIQQFLPCLLGIESPHGQVHGAAGLRSARERPLFLERYLDLPVEQAILAGNGRAIPRGQIVEVGNLAASGGASARLLIIALTDLLMALGFRWVVFTGTRELLNSFGRLGIDLLPLAPADPARMGGELADWGRYYDNAPQVMAGEIRPGHDRLLQQGVYARLGYQALFSEGALPHAAGC